MISGPFDWSPHERNTHLPPLLLRYGKGDKMFGSGIIDVAIGMILVYLFLSLICSVITEWISSRLEWRAKNLEEGIRSLLSDPAGDGYSLKLFDHPLIKGLSKDGKKPSYVPSGLFALALMDIIFPSDSAKGSRTIGDLRQGVSHLPHGLRETISSLLDDAEESLKKARENFEKWFDEGMDRVSGWYKRKSKKIIFACALAVALVLNADTISITQTLFRDPTVRSGLVATAHEIAKKPANDNPGENQKNIALVKEEMNRLHFPLGWTKDAVAALGWVKGPSDIRDALWQTLIKAVGLFLTGLAVSIGAPFWFDMLNKIVNLRSTGTKPDKMAMVPRETDEMK